MLIPSGKALSEKWIFDVCKILSGTIQLKPYKQFYQAMVRLLPISILQGLFTEDERGKGGNSSYTHSRKELFARGQATFQASLGPVQILLETISDLLRVRAAPRDRLPSSACLFCCQVRMFPLRQSFMCACKVFPWSQVPSPVNTSFVFHCLVAAGIYKVNEIFISKKQDKSILQVTFRSRFQDHSQLPEGCEAELACSAPEAPAGWFHSFTSLPQFPIC